MSFTYSDSDATVEKKVNEAIETITILEGNVISHLQNTFGLSPMKLVHTIIYERVKAITPNEWKTKVSELDKE